MPNFADKIADIVTGLSVQLERAKAGQIRETRNRLAELGTAIVNILRRNEATLTGASSSPGRRQGVYDQVNTAIYTTYNSIRGAWPGTLARISSWYVERTANDINRAAGVPLYKRLTDKQIQAIAEGVLIDGAPSGEWWAKQDKALRDKFIRQMRQGVAQNETIDQMIRRVRGTKARGFTDGIMETSKREAEAMVRTSVQAASGAARLRQYEASPAVRALQHHSTADSRTTLICISRDNLIWDKTTKKPLGGHDKRFINTPLHWNCVAPGQQVTTDRGLIPIESVRVGDFVLTHRCRFKRVYAVSNRVVGKPSLVKLKFSSGREILVTDEHPIGSPSASMFWRIKWTRAIKTNVGECVAQHNKKPNHIVIAALRIINIIQIHLNANHAPSQTNKMFVSSNIISHSGTVAASICFDIDFLKRQSKVEKQAINLMLVRKFPVIFFQYLKNRCFGFSYFPRINFGKFAAHFFSCFFVTARIISNHPAAMNISKTSGRFFIFKPPMIFPRGWNSMLKTIFDAINLIPYTDSTRCAAFADSVIRKSKRSFYCPYRFPIFPMTVFDKISKFIDRHFKLHYLQSQTIVEKSIVPYIGNVYNLSVENDESFFVNRILTHNCRSAILGLTYSAPELEKMGFKISDSTRASMDGQVASAMNYEDWLRTKSPAFQREVLGRKRWELWQAGKLPFTMLIDQSARPLRLDELT